MRTSSYTKKIFLVFLFIILTSTSYSQQTETPATPAARARKPKKERILTPDEAKVVRKDAAEFFAYGDYEGALKAYIPLQKAAPENLDYNYRLGYCYVMTNSTSRKRYLFLNTLPEKKV